MNAAVYFANASISPITATDTIPETFDVHRIAGTLSTQSASLKGEIAELEQAAGMRTLARWEQKRLHTMRQLLTRNAAALAVYTLRFN